MSKRRPQLETDEAARRFLESTNHTDHLDQTTKAPLTHEFEATRPSACARSKQGWPTPAHFPAAM